MDNSYETSMLTGYFKLKLSNQIVGLSVGIRVLNLKHSIEKLSTESGTIKHFLLLTEQKSIENALYKIINKP